MPLDANYVNAVWTVTDLPIFHRVPKLSAPVLGPYEVPDQLRNDIQVRHLTKGVLEVISTTKHAAERCNMFKHAHLGWHSTVTSSSCLCTPYY